MAFTHLDQTLGPGGTAQHSRTLVLVDQRTALLQPAAQVLATTASLGPIETGRHRELQRRDLGNALAAQQVRPGQQAEGHQGRGRVAGQADDRHPLVVTEGQWLAGLDRQLPQRQLALFTQGDAQVVRLAHRNAASGKNQIDFLQPGQAVAGFLQIVGQNAGIDHFATQTLQPAAEQAAVAVVDLPGTEGQAGFDKLVTGGQHRHLHAPHHGQFGATQRSCQAQLDRPEARAGGQYRLANPGFLPLRANVLADAQGLGEAHTLIVQHFGVFLHFYTIGSHRQRRPGKDPRTGARQQRLGRMPGKYPLTDRQRLAGPVSQAQGVAVHGTVGPRRQVKARHQLMSQHAAFSGGQGDLLGVFDRRGFGQRQQFAQGFFDRHQGCVHGRLNHGFRRARPA
ncbi:hypothetical protein D9M71_403790 [compost metagenome]